MSFLNGCCSGNDAMETEKKSETPKKDTPAGDSADLEEKLERLNLEITVVITEKLTLKKELERVDTLYQNLKKEYKE